MRGTIGLFSVAVAISLSMIGVVNAQDAKLMQLKEKGAQAPMLKSLDADKKKLEKSFQELLIKEGFIQPNASNCQVQCTVSCTWVNGQCQPTTSCSLVCGL